VAAAGVVEGYARRKGTLCVFDDTRIYWELAGAILAGAPLRIMQWDVPHFALRTPGYPLFLAACRAAFGDRTLPIRLVQAALGAGCVGLVARLVGRVRPGGARTRGAAVPLLAALLAATDPYVVGLSVVILSEALFLPLMLVVLWGMAALWPGPGEAGPRRAPLRAFGTGRPRGRRSWSGRPGRCSCR
jgi:4-amino-4-deoxy-L-arabinose transferase-like glycosyltransferase